MKGKGAKVDQKQLDAQKALEEQKRKGEEEKKMAQQQLKYNIVTLDTGLDLILTDWCLQEVWLHSKPVEFIKEFLSHYLNTKGLVEQFQNIDLLIVSEYVLYNLIFAKQDLQLDQQQTLILVNIYFQLLINNNSIFGHIEKPKTKQDDLQFLKEMLNRHCFDQPPSCKKYFSSESTISSILEYIKQGYFNHFDLYNYVFNNKQKTEEVKITVSIDRPLDSEPLAMARNTGQNNGDNQQEQEIRKQAMEKMLKEEEEKLQKEKQKQEELEKQRKEDEEKLDPRTMEIIRHKIEEAQQKMDQYLKEREEQFIAKLESMPVKKK